MEVKAPEKQKPEMIVLDDINDDVSLNFVYNVYCVFVLNIFFV